MKPISIRFRCFGPYRDEQFVDFTALQKSGVFLITGETGAGKTTILDAMCYALYGRSSGGIRGDLTAMRCKLAERHEETLVEFVFEVNARRYCFTRSLKYARKNINDSHNCLVLEGDTFVPLLENPKATYVNKKAEELIGLTYDQFRQVIILPQGQFEKLLVSDSAGKEAILVSLFRAENWQRITDEMGRRVTERDATLKNDYARWTAGLQAYGCQTLAALEEKLTATEEALSALRAEHAAQSALLTVHKEAYEKALVVYKDFEEWQKRRERAQRLCAQAPRYDALRAVLQRADAAESIRVPYEAYVHAHKACREATARCEEAQAVQQRAAMTYARAQQERQQHEEGRAAYEQQQRELALLENAREVYRVLGEKQHAVQTLETEKRTARAASERATAAFESAHRLWLEAMTAQQDAMTRYQTAQQQYLACIGSVLAEQLEDGCPCPVCGSTAHPAPAGKAQDHLSEAALETYNLAVKTATEAVSTAAARRTAAETAAQKASETLASYQQALAVAQTALDSALSQTIKGITSAAALEDAVKKHRAAMNAYEQTDTLTQQALNSATGNAKAAALALEAAQIALQQAAATAGAATNTWEQALADTAFDSTEAYAAAILPAEKRDEQRTALVAYNTDREAADAQLRESEQQLKDIACPDVAALKAQYEAESARHQERIAALTLAENTCLTMRRDAAALAADKEAHDTARQRVDADLAFVRRLQGRTGVSLQRYVLGVMLSSITVAANRLLKSVHGGRYQLYRTDEIAGSSHKGGLELEVYDAHHNERRSVTTLSGGEKFLVSLSLAIGLSTVVQAQGSGVHIEAMFIDEGFGSLDRDSVADALEVLGGVHRSKGVVGIISHVEQLAETIPCKIVISKGKNGSQCRVTM